MSWPCGTCGIRISSSSKSHHLQSAKHTNRLNGFDNSICDICNVTVTKSNKARHNRSRAHLAALTLTEEKNTPESQEPPAINNTTQSNIVSAEITEADLTLDQFVVADCARYVKWMHDHPNNTTVYRNPRSVVYTVINNLYAAIACNDPTCAWWPQSFKLPANARTWREDILHRSIGDVAMAESVLLITHSTLTFESQ